MRDSNGAFLTPAGVMFYDRIRSNVMELEQAKNEMQHYGEKYRHWVRVAFTVGTLQLYEKKILEFQAEQENFVIKYQECPEENLAQCLENLSGDYETYASQLAEAVIRNQPRGMDNTTLILVRYSPEENEEKIREVNEENEKGDIKT